MAISLENNNMLVQHETKSWEDVDETEGAANGISGSHKHDNDSNDPLNWPYWRRIYIALFVAASGFGAQFSASVINPAYVAMAADLHITVEQASYVTTSFVLVGGIIPMFVVPFSNVYGRRILYLIFTAIAFVANIGRALAPTYSGVIAGSVFNGVGSSIPLGIGAATICDLFPQGQRGFYIGIYTVAVTNGPHVAPIIGGYLADTLGWRWCFWIPAFLQAALWLISIFTFPETLYSRKDYRKPQRHTYILKLLFNGKILDRKIRAKDFWLSFRMIKYAAVTLPCIYYMTVNTYGSILFAVTGSRICKQVWGFDTAQTGLFMGVPLTVGCMIGEGLAGWVSDVIINTYAHRHDGYRKPEARLYLLPLTLLLPIGTATYGYCVQYHKPWIAAAVCMAVSGCGTQIATTVVYTYCTDSYKPQSSEIGAIINLFKSGASAARLVQLPHILTISQSSASTLVSTPFRSVRQWASMCPSAH